MVFWTRANNDTLSCRVTSEEETHTIASQVAAPLRAGDVIALVGDLGAGKTRFVKAIAEAWGIPGDDVNSPTFTLIHEYQGRLPIRHCDTYRLRDAEEFADLGLDELFASDGIALIEWADRVTEYLPRNRLRIEIVIESPSIRLITMTAIGGRAHELLSRIEANSAGSN
ncbi:tRNA (adenosine(37)-N6)-threonylcarbamoyltransferase complex ATPase subunit type 1 TsaE [Schlesneria paludicola]|uniref:tRNA (adenosine(37)-N6)-threonylcarbamoyltransferase complex ATPase subunit type 1 TsaE n=1 Tax=Schlesneria paludicola TaxID=360056 RepID=UPI0007C47ACE|nr:tRNA (adenosine(37)-N6)-threonylcarbamoyltransferase complex ATPase subunit type 1 TsaE [Schlesneria paludicola]